MKRAGAGSALLALALAGPAAADPRDVPTLQHVVEPGESLWSIAAQSDVYDDPYLWPVIYKFNRDQIPDPARIYPHQLLQIPVEIDEETRRAARIQAGAPGAARDSAAAARSP